VQSNSLDGSAPIELDISMGIQMIRPDAIRVIVEGVDPADPTRGANQDEK
jgi:hypothetical protein